MQYTKTRRERNRARPLPGGADSWETHGQISENSKTANKPLMLSMRKAPVLTKPRPPTPTSAFASSWLPGNRRAVTYMLHPTVDEDRLRNMLKIHRATDATILKAVNDLRKLKGLDSDLRDVFQNWTRRGEHWFIIQGDGSVTGVSGTPASYVFHPLHRCQAKTSVRVERIQVNDDSVEKGAKGDAFFEDEQSLGSSHGNQDDDRYDPRKYSSDSSLESIPTLPVTINTDQRIPRILPRIPDRIPYRISQRRPSSIRRFFSRLSQVIRRRSE